MKIRLSLRLFVLAALLFTGTITIFSLSGLSLHYFFSGMDKVMQRTLKIDARLADISPGHPYIKENILENDRFRDTMVIASRWEDLPENIRERFTPEEARHHELTKKMVGNSFPTLSPPKEGYFITRIRVEDEDYFAAIAMKRGESLRIGRMDHVLVIFLTALGATAFFALILILIMRLVSSPVERLRNWAKGLSNSDQSAPVPDFRYSELNTLAGIIKGSLDSVHDSLEREKQFLGFASHELRTPISVTRTNGELLRKLLERDSDKAKQLEVLERIERASATMTVLTETLLWLNRQEEKSLPLNSVHFDRMVRELTEESHYLLKDKPVSVELNTDETELQLPESLCRIVISNLIRNAFQHTEEGEVRIAQSGSELVIINRDTVVDTPERELGFGLGLELTQQLVDKYGWHYTSHSLDNGREVRIDFSEHQEADNE